MKLKDKKIDICEYQYTSDAIGNRVKTLVTVATVWAYFRGVNYDITRIDTFEDCKEDLVLYCKVKE